jgi:hypothetical protein
VSTDSQENDPNESYNIVMGNIQNEIRIEHEGTSKNNVLYRCGPRWQSVLEMKTQQDHRCGNEVCAKPVGRILEYRKFTVQGVCADQVKKY